MIRHVLLISFKPEAQPDEIAALKQAFLDIPDKIPGVLSVEFGENNSPENKNEGYTHCVFMTFEDENARDVYLPHPAHRALGDIFRPIRQDIIVFDYSVEE